MKQSILIAAGGTGGHIYPGLALAEFLTNKGHVVRFVIRTNDPCEKIISKYNYCYYTIPMKAPPKRFYNIINFLWLFLFSLIKANIIITKSKPTVVIGMGGYVSFPIILISRIRGCYTVIHEQNYTLGKANRFLQYISHKIAISFSETVTQKPWKVIFTGNPVRPEILSTDKSSAQMKLGLLPNRFTIFIFGGSQGAHYINTLMVESLDSITILRHKIQIVHISGERDYDYVYRNYSKSGFYACVFPYMDTIGEAYAVSDLVICRAGATTITELIAVKKPAILIPYPYATEKHQEYNARYLQRYDVAKVLLESEITVKKFTQLLIEFVENRNRILQMKDMYRNIPQVPPIDTFLKILPIS